MSADPESSTILVNTTAHSKSKYKPSQERYGPTISPSKEPRPRYEFLAGLAAASINTGFLFPVNKIIFRQMVGGFGTQYAAGELKEEGLRFLYRGILPPLVQKMFSISIMFGTFGQYKEWVDGHFTSSPPVANLFLAACLTGSTEAILTPLERVQMLLQDRRYHRDYKNTLDALVKLRKFGSAEYYRGFTCVLARNGPSNALFFGLRGEIKELLFKANSSIDTSKQESDQSSGPSESQNQLENWKHSLSPPLIYLTSNSLLVDFFSGAILGVFISTLFYPLSVVRVRMQTRAPGAQFLSMVKAFNAVYSERDRKFSRLFHGCSINVVRQFVSWGLINCSYEFVLDKLHYFD